MFRFPLSQPTLSCRFCATTSSITSTIQRRRSNCARRRPRPPISKTGGGRYELNFVGCLLFMINYPLSNQPLTLSFYPMPSTFSPSTTGTARQGVLSAGHAARRREAVSELVEAAGDGAHLPRTRQGVSQVGPTKLGARHVRAPFLSRMHSST